jgi:hypothetical protein
LRLSKVLKGVTVKRSLVVQLLIVIITLAVILPVALTTHNTSVTVNHQAVNENNESESVVFDLQSGQTVNGSLTYSQDQPYGAWFFITGPSGNPLESLSLSTERNHAAFKFTAPISGLYYLGVSSGGSYWTYYLDYSYTISPAPILGLDPVVLIGLVIAAGVILELAVFFRYRVKSEKS